MIDRARCPKCGSDRVGGWIGGAGKHYTCRNCGNQWTAEPERGESK